MKIVADTNIFLAVVMDEPERDRIVELTGGNELLAPDVLPFEIGNALTAMVKRRTLSPEKVLPAWNAVQAIPVELRRIEISVALELACRANIYAYDAYFIECALHARAPLLTLDKKLQAVAEGAGVTILE